MLQPVVRIDGGMTRFGSDAYWRLVLRTDPSDLAASVPPLDRLHTLPIFPPSMRAQLWLHLSRAQAQMVS